MAMEMTFGFCDVHDWLHIEWPQMAQPCVSRKPLIVAPEDAASPQPELNRLCVCGHTGINHSAAGFGRFCGVHDDGKTQCRCLRFTPSEYAFTYETRKATAVANRLKKAFKAMLNRCTSCGVSGQIQWAWETGYVCANCGALDPHNPEPFSTPAPEGARQ